MYCHLFSVNISGLCFLLDYGRHKGHLHNLLEMEAEKTRNTINGAVNSLKKFMEDVGETSRRLGALKFPLFFCLTHICVLFLEKIKILTMSNE
jgi:hypothetical protein